MDYEQFITEIQKYWKLRDKGLKKQANQFLSAFMRCFREKVSEKEEEEILFQFCQEYVDEMKYLSMNMSRRHLPFQMSELLNCYLKRECEKNKMPQMRWAFEIFGHSYNPHESGYDTYHILEKAYMHELCDQKTVDLYFNEQIEKLWWGQHHFPEGCLITKDDFESIVRTANEILSEKYVKPSLIDDFEYYVELYYIYFAWQKNGGNDDFYELCDNKGIDYKKTLAIYYQE